MVSIMSSLKIRQAIFLLILGLFISVGVSCNSKSEDDESDIAVTPALVAVKQFKLKANDSILAKLDSVPFSIDLNSGVIFNADSLPKGTKVSRLIPIITFANSMTKAEISFRKNNEIDTVVNYLKNPEDSIDFSSPVTLNVTAQDGTSEFSYQIKVNVHRQDPDTLVWDRLSTSILPSKFENPVAQKTVFYNSAAYSLIEEYNGEYTLSTCEELNDGQWSINELTLDFTPYIESFTATSEGFRLLTSEGILYVSEDGINWENTALIWTSIIGGYGKILLGIREENGELLFTQYPMSQGYKETKVDPDFPVKGTSVLGVGSTQWSDSDFAILLGGITAEGNLSSAVWAYDGDTWAIINENFLPAVNMPMLARYVVYRDTPYIFTKREMDVWLMFGGVDADGEMNRKVYMTYDNGVHWSLAPDMMQLPESAPTLKGADLIVAGYELSADLADAWTKQESTRNQFLTRTSYTIEGTDINWICPYLYVFGGYNREDKLSVVIWRGVLSRLTFTPLI